MQCWVSDICKITELLYANDIVIVAIKETDLPNNLTVWLDAFEKHGMAIDMNKTEVVIVSKENKQENIYMQNDRIIKSEKFKYLGITFIT